MSEYARFLDSKAIVVQPSGIDVPADAIHSSLFGFQRDLTRWSLRKGRAALFATTGMGKTRMQVEWARLTGERTLILAPLAVARQTVGEAALIGVPVTYARSQADAAPDGITITNYEMLHAFDPSAFGAIVLDESSILKNFEGKVRTGLIRAFRDTPYRLCATATPAPNDIAELANHAEFLGVMKREEMLAAFFVHDDQGWRLKGHARAPFYRWLASWGMSLQRPSDLGYSDEGYALPPLEITAVLVPTDWARPGELPGFTRALSGIQDRSAVRKATMSERVKAAVTLVQSQRFRYNFGYERGTESQTRSQYEGVASEESGARQSVSSGNEGSSECAAAGVVRSGRIPSGETTGEVTSLEQGPSGQEEEPAAQNLPVDIGNLQGSSRASGVGLCDLPVLGHEQSEDVPGGGSRPSDGRGQGASLPELQSGAREVSGRSVLAESSNLVPDEEPWIVWCELNAEQDALAEALKDECVSIDGRTSDEDKIRLYDLWMTGQKRVLITKPRVFGFGLNLQRCARMAFVGLSDSYEAYFQAIRRCWRYGQARAVHAYIVLTEPEEVIYANVCRKQREAEATAAELVKHVAAFERAEIGNVIRRESSPHSQPLRIPEWLGASA